MNRAALNPGLGGVRDIASAIISHEQTKFAVFKLWKMYFFQRISFQGIYKFAFPFQKTSHLETCVKCQDWNWLCDGLHDIHLVDCQTFDDEY